MLFRSTESLLRNLSHITQHVANLDVDCFMVGDNYFILEMNCRFGGQYPFSHLAGANFPKAIVDMLHGKNVEKNLLEVNCGTIGTKDLTPVIMEQKCVRSII